MPSNEPILKDHRLIFMVPTKQLNDNSWIFSAVCDDCKRVMNMKFHWMDVDKLGVRGFVALWERAVRLTMEDAICEEIGTLPSPVLENPTLPLALQESTLVGKDEVIFEEPPVDRDDSQICD